MDLTMSAMVGAARWRQSQQRPLLEKNRALRLQGPPSAAGRGTEAFLTLPLSMWIAESQVKECPLRNSQEGNPGGAHGARKAERPPPPAQPPLWSTDSLKYVNFQILPPSLLPPSFLSLLPSFI